MPRYPSRPTVQQPPERPDTPVDAEWQRRLVRAPRPIAHSTDDPDSWESTHRRWTFYCPNALREAVETECARLGVSRTSYITEALYQHLGRTPWAPSSGD